MCFIFRSLARTFKKAPVVHRDPPVLQLLSSEGVALAGVAGLQAFHEPADALFAGAVSEALLIRMALAAFLKGVVADRRRGSQALLDVTLL